MSTWQKDLCDLVIALPAVAAITDSVWWQQAPSGVATDHVILSQISGTIDSSHGGALSLGNARVQVNCYGTTPARAVALRTAINALVGGVYLVALGNAPASGNEFPSILHAGDTDFPEREVDLYRANTDLLLTYRLAA